MLGFSGGCSCGAVRYRIKGGLYPVQSCHCVQCRTPSGQPAATTGTDKHNLEMVFSKGLRWYSSDEKAELGFCIECGINLFWRAFSHDNIIVFPDTLDQPDGLHIVDHLLVEGSEAKGPMEECEEPVSV